ALVSDDVREIEGVYVVPHKHALVLCVHQQIQVQACERTQALLPMGLGYVEGITHDDVRHGTTPLFAALDVANGSVITQCKPLHRHQEFLSFLRHVDAQVPQDLDVHLICDNDATHKQVERWFGLITQRTIRRGSFDSVADLKRKINAFVEHYNQNPRPFKSTATADSILAKIERVCKVINGTPR
ncbi:transposase, partial [Xanthomonas oryzae pv. oryzae]